MQNKIDKIVNTRIASLKEIQDALILIEQYERQKAPRPNEKHIQKIYKELTSSGGCVVGYFIGNKMLGTCTVNICNNFSWSGRPFAIIENMIVDKQHRNKGIGTLVLNFAKQYAKDKDCYKVALMTGIKRTETFHFYESVGFSGSKIGFQTKFNA